MAIDLKAVFSVQDKGSSKLRNILKQTESLSSATKRASNANSQFTSSMSKVSSGASSVGKSLKGVVTAVASVAAAYVSAQGAAKLFNATIGAAAKYEQSEVAVQAIFNDKSASDAYLKMVDKMAIDSPLLNSGEMLASSKTLVAMTKNVDELGKAWSIIERLMVLDPTQGTDGAAFALKEMWQGDSLSMVERFGLSKKDLNRIKKLDIPQQISEINKLLDGMGITQGTVNSMGETTLGYWAQIQERAQKFMRTIGSSGNSKLGDALGSIVKSMDKMDIDKVAKEIGDVLGTAVKYGAKFGKMLWEWRKPITVVAGAITGILALATLASPVFSITAGVLTLAKYFEKLYKTSEPFKNNVDAIWSKFKDILALVMEGDFKGALESLLGEDTVNKLVTGFNTIRDVASFALYNIIIPGVNLAKSAFELWWAVASPIFTFLGGAFEVLGAVIKVFWDNILSPLVAYFASTFKPALEGLTTVLSTIAGGFDTVSSRAESAKSTLQDFASTISSIKIPDWAINGLGGTGGIGVIANKIIDKSRGNSHYHGLDNVPYDQYQASLHKGERVLDAQENREYTAAKESGGLGGGVMITGNQFTIREEADIEKVAHKLATLIEKEAMQIG